MAGILGNGGMGQPGILGPRIPWQSDPMITMLGASLLGGRTPAQGFQNFGQMLPFAMQAKTGMQQQMMAQQERAEAKATDQARLAQTNEVIKNWQGIPEHLRAYYLANPDQFGSYVTATMKPPESTDDMREYDFAKSQGYTGTFQDYMTEMRRAGAATTNIDNIGSIPQGYEVFKTPEGATQMRPIPGGPADTTKVDAAAAEQKERYGDVVLEDIQRAKAKVKDQSWYAPVSGAGGAALSNIGGSAARDTSALIDTIKSSVAFDRLQAMRESSPTGGALGAVTENELRLLQATLGSLDQAQSQEQLLHNLTRLEEIYSGIMEKFAAYPNAGQMGLGGAGNAPAAGVYDWSPDGGLRPGQ